MTGENTEKLVEKAYREGKENGLKEGKTEASLESVQGAIDGLWIDFKEMNGRLTKLEIRVYSIATLINLVIAFGFHYFK